jgi:hypothetical protein
MALARPGGASQRLHDRPPRPGLNIARSSYGIFRVGYGRPGPLANDLPVTALRRVADPGRHDRPFEPEMIVELAGCLAAYRARLGVAIPRTAYTPPIMGLETSPH